MGGQPARRLSGEVVGQSGRQAAGRAAGGLVGRQVCACACVDRWIVVSQGRRRSEVLEAATRHPRSSGGTVEFFDGASVPDTQTRIKACMHVRMHVHMHPSHVHTHA